MIYLLHFLNSSMSIYTTIPSVKGQVTIPAEVRKKYGIDKNTPLQMVDKGDGVIELKVMRLVGYDDVQFYETDSEVGVYFPKGITPKELIESIRRIDGSDREIHKKT